MDDYQIFISYRREGGDALAGRLADRFNSLGYKVFFDVESMRSGTFNTQILDAIMQCKDILLILPPNALDRCVNSDDWVRQEIAFALKNSKNIIPVLMRGFEFPETLPHDIEKIRFMEGVTASSEYFDAVIQRIEHLLHSQKSASLDAVNSSALSPTVEAAITRAFDEIECRDYKSAKSALDHALTHAPNDPRVLLAAIIVFEEKRSHFYKKYAEIVPQSNDFEIHIIQNSSNKEVYLYAFYILQDTQRIKFCLDAGANPNELHEELNAIVEDAGICTSIGDPEYNNHCGYSTVFFDAVYKRNYDLVECMLQAGASIYPEEACPLKLDVSPSQCATPARCAVMARIMRENDLKMLQLIARYIPEIVNVPFSNWTRGEWFLLVSQIHLTLGYSYAGGIQTPLSYCVEYDFGDYHNRTGYQNSLYTFEGCSLKPSEAVLNSDTQHRYLDTAKWLVENGADIYYIFDAVTFFTGEPQATSNISILSCAVDRNNYEMVDLLAGTNQYIDTLTTAAAWSKTEDITALLLSYGAEKPSTSSDGGCYIATAVYGSYDCPEVWTLRRFRDYKLSKTLLGRIFIKLYYTISPTVVKWVGHTKWFNNMWKTILDKKIKKLQENGFDCSPYEDSLL